MALVLAFILHKLRTDSMVSKFRIVFAKIMYVPNKIISNLVLIYCFITTELEDLC